MKVLLIDVSNIAYRAYTSFFNDVETQDTKIVTSLVHQIIDFKSRFRPDKIVAVFDDGTDYRTAILPEYKGQRVGRKKPTGPVSKSDAKMLTFKTSLKKQLPVFGKLCKHLGITSLKVQGYEADDIIASLSYTLPLYCKRIHIISGDSDLAQLVTDTVHMYAPITGNLITPEVFEESYGFPTTRDYVQAKAIMGDTSDNIPGIGQVGPKKALKILEDYGTLNIKQLINEGNPSKELARVVADPELVKRNIKLIDLRHANKHFQKEDPDYNNDLLGYVMNHVVTPERKALYAFIDKHNLYTLTECNLDYLLDDEE